MNCDNLNQVSVIIIKNFTIDFVTLILFKQILMANKTAKSIVKINTIANYLYIPVYRQIKKFIKLQKS